MSNESGEKGLKVYISRKWELMKTCFLVLTWIVLGAHLEIIGPTLPILADQTGSTLTGISTILVSRNGGYIVANLIGAIFQRIVEKSPEGLLSLSYLIVSIVVFITPLIYNLTLLSILFFFQGISQGITDLSGTSLMLQMWRDNVAAPLNVVHLGFGFGAVFANLLVKPFISEDEKLQMLSDDSTLIIEKQLTNIKIPYWIISFICLLISFGHLILFIIELKKQKTKSNLVIKENSKKAKVSKYSPQSCGNGFFKYGLSMSILWIFYMFFLGGNDQTFGKFFFAYLKTPQFEISTRGATWGMVVYWLSYSIGRLICAVATVFIRVDIALIVLWICGFLLALTWFLVVWIIGLNSQYLFILGAFTGLVFSPTFPLSFGFINQRLNVNPLLLALLLCGSALGGMVFQKLGGIILDWDRKHFPTLLIICVLFSILLFILASIISSIHQKYLIKTKTNIQNKSQEEQQMEIQLNDDQQDYL